MTQRHLLIDSSTKVACFGRFTEEILASEGLTGFTISDLATDAVPDFAPTDVIVLARSFPREAQVRALHKAVTYGATLVALHPSQRVQQVFECPASPTATYPGWVDINEGQPGAGSPIQTHVPIVHLDADPLHKDWQPFARATDAEWQFGNPARPAAIERRLGQGRVAFFLYDLAKAVARIRFGNPDLADVYTNSHWDWFHALDMFIGHVDRRIDHLPQADFHSQLLAHTLTRLAPLPLARLWYFPRASHTTAGILQSDDDYSTPEQFDALTAAVEKRGGTGTFYMMEKTKLPDAHLEALRARGHTFGPHVNAFHSGKNVDLREAFTQAIAHETEAFTNRYGQCSATIQSHCAPWAGHMDLVPVHLKHGYRLLFAYLCGPQHMINRMMCGSGRPMKFCETDGAIHDCWQQPVPTYDDQSLESRIGSEPETVLAEFDLIFKDAAQRTHTPIAILSHPVSFVSYSQPFIEPCFDRFADAGAPIFNADQWLTFNDARRATAVRQRVLDDGQVEISLPPLPEPMCLMLPAAETGVRRVETDGHPVSPEQLHRLEADYLFIDLPASDQPIVLRFKPTAVARAK